MKSPKKKPPKPKAPPRTPEERAMKKCAEEIARVLKKHGFELRAAPKMTAAIEMFRPQG